MSEPIDVDALIAEARNLYDQAEADGMSSVAAHAFLRMADALESTAAELRQERERADEAEARDPSIIALGQYRESLRLEVERVAKEYTRANQAEAELARAREVIEKALALGKKLPLSAERILATYDQKEKP